MQEKKLVHTKEFAIRWGDMDAYGHLNNINYFFYTQEARFEMLKDLNIEFDIHGVAPILLNTSFNFKKQVVWPETLLVETWLLNIDRKKIYFEHIIKSATQSDVIYGVSDALVMWYDFNSKTTVLPPEIEKIL